MEFSKIHNPNPNEHAKNLEEILASVKKLCRDEIHSFNDPKGKALLETSAEVLGGLEKAFHDYVIKSEVWREDLDKNPAKSIDPWD